jgi:hypothetical protein
VEFIGNSERGFVSPQLLQGFTLSAIYPPCAATQTTEVGGIDLFLLTVRERDNMPDVHRALVASETVAVLPGTFARVGIVRGRCARLRYVHSSSNSLWAGLRGG